MDIAAILIGTASALTGAAVLYVAYAVTLSALFAKLGEPGWQAWIPLWNLSVLLRRGGYSRFWAIAFLVPLANLVALVVLVHAIHRINSTFARGAWWTVLGAVLLPVWAGVLGWGSGQPEPGARHRLADRIGEAAGIATVPLARRDLVPAGAEIPDWSIHGPVLPRQAAPGPVPMPIGVPLAAPAPAAVLAQAPAPTSAPAPFPAPVAVPVRPALPAPLPAVATATTLPPIPAAASVPGSVPAAAAPWRPPRSPNPSVAPELAPEVQGTSAVVALPSRYAPEHPVFAARAADGPGSTDAPGGAAPASAVTAASAPPRGEPLLRAVEDLDGDAEATAIVRATGRWYLSTEDGAALDLSGPVAVLGRRPSADGRSTAQLIEVPDPTRTISKTHARLERRGRTWLLRDLGSTNGVAVVGRDGTTVEVPVGVAVELTGEFYLGDARLALRSRR